MLDVRLGAILALVLDEWASLVINPVGPEWL